MDAVATCSTTTTTAPGTPGSGATTTVTVPGTTTTVDGTTTVAGTATPTTRQKKAASGYVASLMSWTFAYTPHYTEVSALHASNLVRRLYITLTCTGHGCPFKAKTIFVKTSCHKVNGHERCTLPKTVDLTREFGTHHLAAKAQVSVMLRHKGWVGKYYRFTMRAAKTPAIVESCLAPNSTKPGVGCH